MVNQSPKYQMREFITIVEAQNRSSFRLHPALNPAHYRMTDSLADHNKWQAMTYEANSVNDTDPQVGQFAQIGYVMISLKDDTIIPISRSDEHNQGTDVLYRLSRKTKGAIVESDYLPIWSLGNNYIYHKSDIPRYLTALGKFLAYGGPNGVLKGTSDMRGLTISSRQFVEMGGNIDLKPGELAPLGAEVYAAFSALSTALSNARNSDQKSIIGVAFRAALDVLKLLMRDRLLQKGFSYKDAEALIPKLRDAQKAGDLRALEEMFFSFHGVKNIIHNRLRQLQKGAERSWEDDDLRSVWGDIDLAVDMLGRF